MKRGLVQLDPGEVAPAEYRARVHELQQLLRVRGLRAAAIYGDVYRSGDLTYLTNLCLYWNEGVLVVPAEGEPALLTKLSARVQPWMRATTILEDIRSGQDLVQLLADFLGSVEPGPLGLVEKSWWPAPLLQQMAARLPAWTLEDAGPIVRKRRQAPGPSELALLRRGAAVGAQAMQAALRPGLSPSERRGAVERDARTAGVEDVYCWIDGTPDEGSTLQIVPEYRGYWTQVARVLLPASGAPSWAERLLDGYRAAVARLAPGVARADLAAAAAAPLAALGPEFSWELDVVHHTDLETGGEYRLPGESEEPLPAGSVFSLSLALYGPGGGRACLADTFHMESAGASCLTEAAGHPVTREGGRR